MQVCKQPTDFVGNFTSICNMPTMFGTLLCRHHIKENPYYEPSDEPLSEEKIQEKIKKANMPGPKVLTEAYLNTDISFENYDLIGQVFPSIKKHFTVVFGNELQTKFDQDAPLTYKIINDIFEKLKGKYMLISVKNKLKNIAKKLETAGWTEYDDYCEIYDKQKYTKINADKKSVIADPVGALEQAFPDKSKGKSTNKKLYTSDESSASVKKNMKKIQKGSDYDLSEMSGSTASYSDSNMSDDSIASDAPKPVPKGKLACKKKSKK
jgi:hypothetical protein